MSIFLVGTTVPFQNKLKSGSYLLPNPNQQQSAQTVSKLKTKKLKITPLTALYYSIILILV
jgi:hypothetical protein